MAVRGRGMTVQARLTTFYGVLFLLTGFLLVGLVVGAVFAAPTEQVGDPGRLLAGTGLTAGQIDQIALQARQQTREALEMRLLVSSAVAIGAMTVIAVASGLFMARRVLRPVRTVSATARRLSENELHQRVPVPKPDDELAELAETFNSMLARLERAFTAQRLFTANASHELRGPMTAQRVLVEVLLSTPDASPDAVELAQTLHGVLLRQQRLVEGLFELTTSQHGLQARTSIDLTALTQEVLDRWESTARGQELRLISELSDATTWGDPTLIEILVDNLVRNAITHNEAGGWLRVHLDGSTLTVDNTGTELDLARLAELNEPFRRGNADRTSSNSGGAGLGLTIVDTIAAAHGAIVSLRPRSGGGLSAEIQFADER
jgi:signal transduction histidine kinase